MAPHLNMLKCVTLKIHFAEVAQNQYHGILGPDLHGKLNSYAILEWRPPWCTLEPGFIT
jgi:hypothetical protein